VRGIMGEIVASENEMTVMDMEASLEHLSRGTVRHVDALLIVAEPYYRALETAARTVPLARGLGIERIYAIANKIRNPEDEKAVTDYCRTHDLEIIATIPFDEKVTTADRAGRSILDAAPDSHLVREVTTLAGKLLEKLSRNASATVNKEPLPGEASGRC